MIKDYSRIKKTIKNDLDTDQFISEVELFHINSLDELNINKEHIKLFKSGRHKNDMPTVCEFGLMNDSMIDGLTIVNESGTKVSKNKERAFISDSLTIIGNDDLALMICFLGGKHHLIRTVIKVDEKGNFKDLSVIAEINKVFRPGEVFITEPLEIYYTDNISESINDYCEKKKNGTIFHKPYSVYCTWYYYGKNITFKDCLINLNKIKEYNLNVDVFQIDDGWEAYIGSWNPNNKFPDLLEVSLSIQKYGLIPGIWTSPFIFEKNSFIYKNHIDWMLKDYNNKPCIFNVNNKDYYIIDITIPETHAYFKNLYRSLNELGFKYFKLDFTRAPLIQKNADYCLKNKTVIEYYVEACKQMRYGMGEDSFFLMCGGLYDPLIGIVDGQRTGSDVLSMWSLNKNRGGKNLPYTFKQNVLRYYMGNWWNNDPDSLMIRKNKKMYKGMNLSLGLLTDEEVKVSLLNELIGHGIISFTEALDKIDLERLSMYNHVLPLKSIETKIDKLLSIDRYPSFIKVLDKDTLNNYLIIFNFNDQESIKPVLKLKDILYDNRDCDMDYSVIDFYQQEIYHGLDNESSIVVSDILPHSATILKLVKDDDLNENIIKKHYIF